jgi:hypothetical protein
MLAELVEEILRPFEFARFSREGTPPMMLFEPWSRAILRWPLRALRRYVMVALPVVVVVSLLFPATLRFTELIWTNVFALTLGALWTASEALPPSVKMGLMSWSQLTRLPGRLALVSALFVVPGVCYVVAARLVPGVSTGSLWPAAVLGCCNVFMVNRVRVRLLNPNFQALCQLDSDTGKVVACAGRNRIHLWDPIGGQTRRMGRTPLPALALCVVETRGRSMLASSAADGRIHLWDPFTLRLVRTIGVAGPAVPALCAIRREAGTDLLAAAGVDAVIRLWDPATGEPAGLLSGHAGPVLALCRFEVDGRPRLASAGYDDVVRIWDPDTGAELQTLSTRRAGDEDGTGRGPALRAVCQVREAGRTLVAAAGDDGTVGVWDPVTGEQVRAMSFETGLSTFAISAAGGGAVHALCEVMVGGRSLVAAGGDFPGVQLWDPATGRQEGWIGWGGLLDDDPECGWVRGLCTVEAAGEVRIVTAGYDETARTFILDPRPTSKAS